jgi:hypothetical protein
MNKFLVKKLFIIFSIIIIDFELYAQINSSEITSLTTNRRYIMNKVYLDGNLSPKDGREMVN